MKEIKPFDITLAKAGMAVCTRDGRQARIVSFDVVNEGLPILALVRGDDGCERPYLYDGNGHNGLDGEAKRNDLVMHDWDVPTGSRWGFDAVLIDVEQWPDLEVVDVRSALRAEWPTNVLTESNAKDDRKQLRVQLPQAGPEAVEKVLRTVDSVAIATRYMYATERRTACGKEVRWQIHESAPAAEK